MSATATTSPAWRSTAAATQQHHRRASSHGSSAVRSHMLSLLLIIVATASAHARHIKTEAQYPTDTVVGSSSLAPAPTTSNSSTTHASPRYSLHSCVGETNTLRSCHFRNLYLHVEDRRWVYLQSPEDPPRIKMAGQRFGTTNFSAATPEDEERYYIQGSFIELQRHDSNFNFNNQISITPEVQVGTPPATDNLVLGVAGLSMLWEFTANSAYSYGHMLLNDWFPIFLTLSTHKEHLPRRFNIFSHNELRFHYNQAPAVPGDGSLHVGARYLSAWSNTQVGSLDTLVNEAKASGRAWICFSEVVIGESGYLTESVAQVSDSISVPSAPTMFNALNWRSFRNAVYTGFGLLAPGVGETDPSRQQSIVILLKAPADYRRRVLNPEELKQHLTLAFPSAKTAIVEFELLTPLQQLETMRGTDVFITLQGSAAFRLVFMGKGTSVIMVGSAIDPLRRVTNDWTYTPFFELPRYFAGGGANILKYHVLAEECNLSCYKLFWIFRRCTNYYDASVAIVLPRMEALVRQALWENRADREWERATLE
ncbi:MAG: hypothetical protein WDW36_009580 [Sanguina aurantia]